MCHDFHSFTVIDLIPAIQVFRLMLFSVLLLSLLLLLLLIVFIIYSFDNINLNNMYEQTIVTKER